MVWSRCGGMKGYRGTWREAGGGKNRELFTPDLRGGLPPVALNEVKSEGNQKCLFAKAKPEPVLR